MLRLLLGQCQLVLDRGFDLQLAVQAVQYVAAERAMLAAGSGAYPLRLFEGATDQKRGAVCVWHSCMISGDISDIKILAAGLERMYTPVEVLTFLCRARVPNTGAHYASKPRLSRIPTDCWNSRKTLPVFSRRKRRG